MDAVAILNEFSDTLLFEYDCATGALEFAPAPPAELGLPDRLYLSARSPQPGVPEAAEKLARILRAVKVRGAGLQAELAFRALDGGVRFYLCRCKMLSGLPGQPRRIGGKLTDITDRFDREQDLMRRARMDVLTGVYNRSAEELIAQRLASCRGGALFMIDLDNFKRINDTYGHRKGDQVLVAVTGVLKRLFRQSDIIARVGGDEFVAFIEGPADPDLACSRAQMILERLQTLRVPGVDLPASVSIGIALSPPLPPDYAQLHHAADQAMYEVKRARKNCWRVCATPGR